MSIFGETSKGKNLSFIEFCKLVEQSSAMSQSVPYYGRSPAKKIENVRRMIVRL